MNYQRFLQNSKIKKPINSRFYKLSESLHFVKLRRRKGKIMQTLAIINVDTNEILYEKKIPDGAVLQSKVITQEQREFCHTMIKDFNEGVTFGKLYVKMLRYIDKELTGSEWKFFTSLIELIDFESCTLRKHGDKRCKALSSIEDISKVLGKSYALCYKQMKALIAKQLIIVSYTGDGDDKITVYRCNPYIFFRGKNLEISIWKDFNNTCWAKYNEIICQEKYNYKLDE